nr:DUF4258 domain-containing protein [Allomuricauda sp.]
MAFLRRLGWYLVGLSIGIIFLIFFLQKKADETGTEFCYFPNCRVLKDMRSKPIVFGDKLEAAHRDTLLINSFLKDGDINFRKSDTQSEPCKTYFVEQTIKEVDYTLQVKSCTSNVIVERLVEDN